MEKTLAYYVSLLRKDFTGYCNTKLQELGLSQGLLYFIIYVGKHPDCSPKELAQGLAMDTGHVTRSLAKLEQGGFLVQETDPKDRRAHLLRLLPKGEEAFRASYQLFCQWDDAVLQGVDAKDRALLFGLLERLAAAERQCGRLPSDARLD